MHGLLVSGLCGGTANSDKIERGSWTVRAGVPLDGTVPLLQEERHSPNPPNFEP